jgi:CheY-like chemotaxis protein
LLCVGHKVRCGALRQTANISGGYLGDPKIALPKSVPLRFAVTSHSSPVPALYIDQNTYTSNICEVVGVIRRKNGATPDKGGMRSQRFAQLICIGSVLAYNATKRHHVSPPKVGQRLSSIQILISDDFADWRRQVRLLLQARPEWQVISEASDGLEAVQKAQDLKPEIILLDIGLPKLNGIEAARRIRQLSPNSKIIFLSQNNDLDIVRAALSTGIRGYVRKTDVKRELLPAVDAVLRGKQFVSSSLKGREFSPTPQ